jgi:superfamily II DNA/RNA helicase
MQFNEIINHPGILQAIEELGHVTPTPIQQLTIPEAINGVDLLASAQTGTGKTAAFLIPALLRMTNPSEYPGKGPRILILVPTRELACQVKAEAIKYSKHLPKVKTVCIYGGVPYAVQFKELARHVEILVATPGRLIDHIERGKVDLSRIEMLVLDEADRMLDMGFISAVEQLAELLPKERQTLFFSATFKKNVVNLAKKLLNNPKEIQADHPHEKHKNIEQHLLKANNLEHKYSLLDTLLQDTALNQVIVFTSTKKQADHLVDRLVDQGQEAGVLHGDIKQRQRTKTVSQLKDGKIRVLVATDVAARGIDIPSISHVINFDLPPFAEDYVHRIGRTGRAGAKGIAFSFVSKREFHLIREIEKFTGQKLASDQEFSEKEQAEKKPRSRRDGDRRRDSSSDRRESYSKPREFSPRKKEGFSKSKDFSSDRREDSFKPKEYSSDRKEGSSRGKSFSSEKREGFSKSRGFSSDRREGSFKPKEFSSDRKEGSSPRKESFFDRKENKYPSKDFSSRGSKKSFSPRKDFKKSHSR